MKHTNRSHPPQYSTTRDLVSWSSGNLQPKKERGVTVLSFMPNVCLPDFMHECLEYEVEVSSTSASIVLLLISCMDFRQETVILIHCHH